MRDFYRWAQSLKALSSVLVLDSPKDNERLASAYMYISNEHFFSILEVCSKNIPSSGFALIRPQYEAFTRGLWVLHCANDAELKKVLSGKNFPKKNQEILDDLNEVEAYRNGDISKLSKIVWKRSHDFTHGGSVQVSWHIGKNTIGSMYTSKEISGLLELSSSMSISNSIALAKLCDDEKTSTKLVKSHKRIFS
mgnify:CR=1 FL=1